ncbi:MAG: hypothetical protein JSS29_01710 [Proteobacteria bacterium]|nr:hypothetical protein [Pseudomonadota bacterium]
MRTLQASISNLVLSVAIANCLAFAIAVFGSIANPMGSQTVLSTWAIVFGVALCGTLSYFALATEG